MSIGEQLGYSPEMDHQIAMDFIAEFRQKSQKIGATLSSVTARPTQIRAHRFSYSVFEVKDAVNVMYGADFFKDTDNPLLVSSAITALTESLREVTAYLKSVDPNSGTRTDVDVPTGDEPKDLRRLTVRLDDAEVDTQANEIGQTVDHFTKLILERDKEGADKISKPLAVTTYVLFEHLEAQLFADPKIQASLEKDARKEKTKDNAKMVGMFLVSSALVSAAGQVSYELVSKYL